MLIHREHTDATPARLIIEYGQVRTENANRAHGFGVLDPDTFAPYPKNPVIGAFFREIHRADELGSGMRKLMRYGKAFGGADPEMIEGDVFRIVVKVPEFRSQENIVPDVTPQVTPQVTPHVTPQVRRLISVVDVEMTRTELMEVLDLKDRMHFANEYMQPALDDKLLEMTIPNKPTSRLQKYRLTDAGKLLLKSVQK